MEVLLSQKVSSCE